METAAALKGAAASAGAGANASYDHLFAYAVYLNYTVPGNRSQNMELESAQCTHGRFVTGPPVGFTAPRLRLVAAFSACFPCAMSANA